MFTKDYFDAMENELKLLTKIQERTRDLLKLYSFRQNNQIIHKATGLILDDSELKYVLGQIYTAQRKHASLMAFYEATEPVAPNPKENSGESQKVFRNTCYH
jgi:hypothetical protein